MIESILGSVKDALGLEPSDTDFDNELIMDINSVFLIFNQLGLGPDSVYQIEDEKNTWDEFFGLDTEIPAVKTDLFMRVKLMFDSSTMTSGVINVYQEQIEELEWRLNLQVE